MDGKVTAEAAVGPYERLAELAEAELALCQEGRFEELDPHYEEAGGIAAGLTEQTPPQAQAPLERAARAHDAIAALLATGIEDTRAELAQPRRGRDAARSYGAAG